MYNRLWATRTRCPLFGVKEINKLSYQLHVKHVDREQESVKFFC